MRILKAYKEAATGATVNKTFYQLNLSVKLDLAVTDIKLIAYFVHNWQRHAIICYREGIDSKATADVFFPDENPNYIFIKARKVGATYYLPAIGEAVAAATGATLVSNSISTTANNFVLRSFTHSQSYLDFTDNTGSTYTLVNSRTAPVIATPTGALTLSSPITLDIDSQTVFALTIQSFEFSAPSEPKTTVSNTFTLPITNSNNSLLNGADLLQDANNEIYSTWYIDYWVDSDRHIEKARLMVNSVNNEGGKGRIFCTIYSKQSVWDRISSVLWGDFMKEYYIWMASKRVVQWSTFSSMLTALNGSTSHINLNLMYGDFHSNANTLHTYSEGSLDNVRPEIIISQLGVSGGHFGIFLDSIIECIKDIYGLDLLQSEEFPIFGDTEVIGKIYIPTRHLSHATYGDFGGTQLHTVVYNNGLNINDTKISYDKTSKTIYDFIVSIVRQLNGIIDSSGFGSYTIYPMDALLEAPVIDFSGKFTGDYEFAPMIPDIAQSNIIDFTDYSELIPSGVFKKTIICNNKNIEKEKELVKIPCFVPPAFMYDDYQILGLFEKKSFEEFTLMVTDMEDHSVFVTSYGFDTKIEGSIVNMQAAVFLGMASSYNVYGDIIAYPKYIKAKKWISYEDVRVLKFFALYHINEFGGTFFINKIAGLNPDGSKTPTDIELIFVNRKLPT